jgi:GR25 family glycosyltransferase involved in LPS biosynthesis
VNTLSWAGISLRLAHRMRLRTRVLDPCRRVNVFSRHDEPNALRRIYVINLDRMPDRWRRVRHEFGRFRERHGSPVSTIARRFSAVDARHVNFPPDPAMLNTTFTLADQLTVDPNPLLQADDAARARQISMTRQEVAVALSHIEVWKLIANGDVPCALVLEDDVFFSPGFARNLRRAWSAMIAADGQPRFDLLYLAFRDLHQPCSNPGRQPRRRMDPGVWEASGYVLTREGARELLR